MTVSHLCESDLNDIASLQSRCIKEAWNEQMLVNGLKAGNLFGFVAREKKELLGFVTFSSGEEYSDIYDICVNPDYLRRGIASLLMQTYFTEMVSLGIKKSFLEVRKSNFSAINLYLKLGYKEVSVRKKYYSNGEDALIMVKETL